jgi:hypothetical protein
LDKKAFAEIQERLLEVNKVIAKLDPSIRVAAFDFLKPYILGGNIKTHSQHESKPDEGHDAATSDLAELVSKFGSDSKPSDNARLLTAWWFCQYGSTPFSIKWLKETSDSTGLTIPASPGMTLRIAMEKGKNLYKALGEGGLFKPTIVGETVLKATYKVKKGTKAVPAEAEK